MPQVMPGGDVAQCGLDFTHQGGVFGDARDQRLVIRACAQGGGEPVCEGGWGDLIEGVHLASLREINRTIYSLI